MDQAVKEKKVLQKLREDAKHTKRAKAMASRTKDNLQVSSNKRSACHNNAFLPDCIIDCKTPGCETVKTSAVCK